MRCYDGSFLMLVIPSMHTSFRRLSKSNCPIANRWYINNPSTGCIWSRSARTIIIKQTKMEPTHRYMTRSVTARACKRTSNKICSLPMELLEMILFHLSIVDFHFLRHTCKFLYQRCGYQADLADPSTIETDLSRAHLHWLKRMPKERALRVKELSVRSFCGRPLGLCYEPPMLTARKSKISADLERVLKSFKHCRTFRI
ncbi:hypothetical protein BO94DRAFT_323840 [Aspergillus sclerotioniger CBS 115572]|uniref:F-box domain-containing protein n=1 Tax=Aspergillus sclerotioniger CBS 115572 TaxID=1450535 RepID=A0A317XCC9_9EURO|nr:hypothetical protein BO94DRAFT_323840 [Aspergillus sclerotioniger CBS 115572]PWY94190.1 hypothetical protein BO94DRAFT_323840 [Aspergillus sclerotioniger CBS 115572]